MAIKKLFENLSQRKQDIQAIPENPFVKPPEFDHQLQNKLEENIEQAFRQSVQLCPVPEWAEDIKPHIIDWHEVLALLGKEKIEEIIEQANWKQLYPFAAIADQIYESLFQSRLELIARLLDAAMQADVFHLCLRADWFLFYEEKIACNFNELTENSESSPGVMLNHYELGAMHPGLRKREIPADFELTSAVLHAFIFFIFNTLCRPSQPRTPSDFQAQVEYFRALNPKVPAELRNFFRKNLFGTDKSPYSTALEAYQEFCAILAKVQSRKNTVYQTAILEYKAESLFGRNKAGNDNEDIVFKLSGLPEDKAFIGIADGVSTASLGTGWLAANCIKEHLQTNKQDYINKINLLPDPAQDLKAWQDAGEKLLKDFFSSVHTKVVQKINNLPAQEPNPEPATDTMASTLVMALVQGNQVMIAHWGDSRAYLISGSKIIRLTEDHNKLFNALIGMRKANQPFSIPKKSSTITRTIGSCTFDSKTNKYEPLTLDKINVSIDHCVLYVDDYLLLCSDGLLDSSASSNELKEEAKILNFLQKNKQKKCREIARQLARQADDNHGNDNISLMLLKLQSGPAQEPKLKNKSANAKK